MTNKLNFTALLYFFAFCNEPFEITQRYAESFETLMAETGKDVNYEEWYNEQVNNIV